jgi:phosphatidylcholine synthase
MASKAMAWSVHLFTASGAVLAVFALWEIGRGGFARAAICLLAALAIDSVDGTLARRVRVAERLPGIDGRRLDDIVDYLNYVIVPIVFLLALSALVHPALAALPALASAYGFAQVDAKTEDDFFLGWPSYWNVVALYAWLLDVSPGATTAWVVLFSVLVFVPLKYVYPSKLRRLRAATAIAGTIWVSAMALISLWPPGGARTNAAWISLVFPAYYVALSAWLGQWWPQVSRSERKLRAASRRRAKTRRKASEVHRGGA